MEYLIVAIIWGVWIVHMIQSRIGEDQAREWIQFKQDNPHLFRKVKKD